MLLSFFYTWLTAGESRGFGGFVLNSVFATGVSIGLIALMTSRMPMVILRVETCAPAVFHTSKNVLLTVEILLTLAISSAGRKVYMQR